MVSKILNLDELTNKVSVRIYVASKLSENGGAVELTLIGYDDDFSCARELMEIMSNYSDVGRFSDWLGILTASSIVYFNKILYKGIDLYPLMVELSKICNFSIELDQGLSNTIVFNFYLLQVLANNPRASIVVYDKMLEFANNNNFSCSVEVNTVSGVFVYTLRRRYG